LAALELDARQLRDAFDELRDLVAELGADVVDPDPRVLDRVVEERGGERRLVHPQAGQDLGRAPGMVDELLAGAAPLALVGSRRGLARAGQQLPLDRRLWRPPPRA